MRLLQAEDLRHHVVGGGVEQDPARGQTHHDVAAHRRQANGDSIGAESLGVEHLPQVVRSQRVDGQDALVREAPLAAGNEDRQQLAVRRDVAAGVVVDLTVWHQDVDRSCRRRNESSSTSSYSRSSSFFIHL